MGLFLDSKIFHWSICLSLCQIPNVLITIVFKKSQEVVNSSNIPPYALTICRLLHLQMRLTFQFLQKQFSRILIRVAFLYRLTWERRDNFTMLHLWSLWTYISLFKSSSLITGKVLKVSFWVNALTFFP